MTTVLETNSLERRFGELLAVDDVTVSIDSEDITSIIGPRSSGVDELVPSKVVSFRGEAVAQLKLLGRFETDGGGVVIGDPYYLTDQRWPMLPLEAGEYEVWAALDAADQLTVIDVRKQVISKSTWWIEADPAFSDGTFYYGNDSRHMVVIPGDSFPAVERVRRLADPDLSDREAYYWFLDSAARAKLAERGLRFNAPQRSDVILFGPGFGVVRQLYGVNEAGRCDRYLLFE